MTCHRIGRPPISTSGFGIVSVCSRSRVPRPPQRMTTGSSTAGTLPGVAGRAGHAAAVEQPAGRAPELEQRAVRLQHDAKGAVDGVGPPGHRGRRAVEHVAAAAAGAGHVLRDPLLRAVALEIVVVPAEHDAGAAGEPVPERLKVGRAAVGALAVARAVPERDAAVACGALGPPLEPADLRRAGPVRGLGVEVEDLPADDLGLRPGRVGTTLAAGPVLVVAGEAVVPLVVADRRLRHAGEPAEPRVVPAPELLERAGLVDVAEIEEAVRLPAPDETGDAIGADPRGGEVADRPDDGALIGLGAGRRRRRCGTRRGRGQDGRECHGHGPHGVTYRASLTG